MSTTRMSVVLARQPDCPPDALEAALRSAAATLRAAGWRVDAAVAVEPDAFLDTAHGACVPARVDGLLSWDLAQAPALPDLATVLGEVVSRLGKEVDPVRSGVVYGEQHDVIEGDGPLQISFALRRTAAMNHDEFSDYWLNSHGRMAKEAPRRKTNTGYRQLHADQAACRTLAAAAGLGQDDYDGLVSSDHVDAARMKKIFGSPAVAEAALADERNFIDHDRSAIGLLRRL
jgi:hypothetical protein